MNSTISRPNFIITIVMTYLFYKVSLMTCDYFEFFKKKETIATIEAREIINSVNKTKFVFDGPAKWEKLNKYDSDSCVKDNGKINWAVVEVFRVTPSWVKFTKPSGIPQFNFLNEDAFFYYLTDGFIPRHLKNKFLRIKKYEKIVLLWKNIIRDERNEDSQDPRNILCSKIVHEIRLATPQEIEEYSKIEPDLLVPTPR